MKTQSRWGVIRLVIIVAACAAVVACGTWFFNTDWEGERCGHLVSQYDKHRSATGYHNRAIERLEERMPDLLDSCRDYLYQDLKAR